MNLSLLIARRHLGSKSREGFASLVTLVSFFGIVLGVAALLIVVSVMNGFDRELKQRILGAVPHVYVHGASSKGLPLDVGHSVVESITPFQQAQVLITSQSGSQLVGLYGLLPELEVGASILPSAMEEGTLNTLTAGENNLVLGASAARRLGLTKGDSVRLIFPAMSIAGKTFKPKLKQARFVGTFSLGSELDYRLGLMHLESLNRIVKKDQGVRITLDNIYAAPEINRQLSQAGYRVHDWTKHYGDFFATVRMEKVMMFIVLTFVVAVASFSIVAGLSMMVNAKRREIAILRTMGMGDRQVLGLFFIQGSIVTLAGVFAGLIFGLPLAFYAPDIIAYLEGFFGFSIVEGTYFDRVPTDPRLEDILAVVGVTTLIGTVATFQPARRAARLEPLEILRYE